MITHLCCPPRSHVRLLTSLPDRRSICELSTSTSSGYYSRLRGQISIRCLRLHRLSYDSECYTSLTKTDCHSLQDLLDCCPTSHKSAPTSSCSMGMQVRRARSFMLQQASKRKPWRLSTPGHVTKLICTIVLGQMMRHLYALQIPCAQYGVLYTLLQWRVLDTTDTKRKCVECCH